MKTCYIGIVPKWAQAKGPLPNDSEGSYWDGFFAAIFEGRRNTLGFAVAYLQPLIQGGNYTP